MTPVPLILLPPSEGKSSGGEDPPLEFENLSFGALNPTRTRMAKALGQLSNKPRVAQKLLGVKGVALEQAKSDNTELLVSPTRPAIERYTGVMYDAIDYKSLGIDARERFDSSTIIMSGLFGLVRPQDMIPTYKLKMGARLRLKKTCAAVWKPLVTKSLQRIGENRVVWDLLPNEHSAAWDPSQINYETRFQVQFLETRPDGNLKTVTHWSKALKGSLVRYLVENPDAASATADVHDFLGNFDHPEGFHIRPEHTIEKFGAIELMFVRDS